MTSPAPGSGLGAHAPQLERLQDRGMWTPGPDRRERANCATVRPARRLTIEATVSV
jgi:hypothetical protein